RAVGVEMFLRRPFGIAVWHRLSPMDEICRSATLDCADPFIAVPREAAIALRPLIPEREVERVERAFGHHRLGLPLLPMDAIGRDEGVQFALDARQGLVTFVGAGGG